MREVIHRCRLTPAARAAIGARDPTLGAAAESAVFVAGRAVEGILRVAGAGAMTLGRHVLVRRALLTSTGGTLRLPADLVAHELAHVRQYEREGAVVFLARYVAAYAHGLRGLDAAARHAAYRRIPAEREARTAAAAFAASTLALEPL